MMGTAFEKERLDRQRRSGKTAGLVGVIAVAGRRVVDRLAGSVSFGARRGLTGGAGPMTMAGSAGGAGAGSVFRAGVGIGAGTRVDNVSGVAPVLRRAIVVMAAALVLTTAAVPPAHASGVTQEGSFDVVFRGIVAGRATFRANENARAYAVSGRLQSTGLLRVISDIRYDAQVTGARIGDRLAPLRYSEEANTGQRQQASVMAWQRGIPMIEMVSPPQDPGPDDVDPRTQRGTVDPMTALYLVLRDVPHEKACSANSVMFDGRRRSQLRLSAPKQNGSGIVCNGEYRRLDGFSAAEMAERVRFPFSLTYAPNGNGTLKVTEVVVQTTYGPARLVRR